MAVNITIGDRLGVIRAAIAATIAERLNAPLVSGPGEPDRSYLSLAGGLAGFGHQLVEELLPLELLMRAATGEPADTTNRESLDQTDLYLDSLMARLHDTILNPALRFQLEQPLQADIAPINRIYGDALRSAEVAGRIELSPEAKAADELLFDDGEPTPILQKFRSYEHDVNEVADAIDALPSGAAADERDRLQGRLQRLKAEWAGIGHKREVEDAFRLITRAHDEAGFEHNRSALLTRFESGEKFRRDQAGLTYYRSHLIPTAPLFDDKSPAWTRVTLGHQQLVSALSPTIQDTFGISGGDVERSLDQIADVTFEHLACEIRREWLDPDFFTARYWRLRDGSELSDGVGGGKLPCLPRRVVFLRKITFSVDDVGIELISPRPRSGEVTLPKPLLKRVALGPSRPEPQLDTKLVHVARTARLDSALRVINSEQVALAKTQLITPRSLTTVPKGHTTAARSAAARPQVRTSTRDHRTTNRPGFISRLPDLLATKQVLVPDKPDKPGDRDVRLTGTVSVAGGQEELLDRLVVTVEAHEPGIGDVVAVDLARKSRTKAQFATVLRERLSAARNKPIRKYAVRLHRADGEVIAEHLIDMASSGGRLQLKWKAISQPSLYAIAEDTPVVHAYEVRVLPKCPNPDDALEWA